jgi:hypothetical protein
MDALVIAAEAPFRLFGHLDLGDQATRRRIPPGELDAGCLADQTASSVAPDEIFRPQRLAVEDLDVDAGVVLRGDQLGRAPGQVLCRRRRRPAHQRAHRLADRHQWHADTGQQLREVRRRAHRHLRAECRTASPTIGSTSPSDSYVDNNTRISLLTFP